MTTPATGPIGGAGSGLGAGAAGGLGDGGVDASVVIPTFGRGPKLAACLASLARQHHPADRFEVLVGLDGPDPGVAELARRAWREAGGSEAGLVIESLERCGLAAVRNRMLELARGRIMISTNDDVVAAPQWVSAHVAAHREPREHSSVGGGAVRVIVGDSPWRVQHPDTLMHRLLRETSMVFFYDRMNGPESPRDRRHDWGFRHCFGLNFSAPLAAVRELGGFGVFPEKYGYEDVEMGWRLRERFGAPVLYRPEARVEHDHAMTTRDYLRREFLLGAAAIGFAHAAPACARELFGRDITTAEELDYSRQYVERERTSAARALSTFGGLDVLPADAIGGAHGAALIELVYQQHLALKRWMWRAGLVAFAEGRHGEGPRWP